MSQQQVKYEGRGRGKDQHKEAGGEDKGAQHGVSDGMGNSDEWDMGQG